MKIPTKVLKIQDQEFLDLIYEEVSTSSFVYKSKTKDFAMNGHTMKYYFQNPAMQEYYLKEIPPYELLTEKTLHRIIDYLPQELRPYKGTDLHLRYDLFF